MKFEFHLNQNLPKLSWAISFSKKTQIIDVYHGSNVEIEENCFFEGAWDGEFSEYLFEDSTFFVGTGCKILGNDPEQNFWWLLQIMFWKKCLLIAPMKLFMLPIHLLSYLPSRIRNWTRITHNTNLIFPQF